MKANFAMAIHFHQPVGNFDNVIENACNKCYVPFLETLKKHSDIRMSLHFTGCLFEWIEEHKPEVIDMIKQMVKNKQVEIIGGGFYEPILATIPKRDRLSQIGMLREYIRKTFGCEANGAWIAERVWEPDLPSTLYDANVKFTILDDTHFLYSGITKEKTYGYYTTEDNGKPVFVFPSDKTLRYMIPFKMPEECFNYMRHVAGNIENPLFVYGDDGEKFGEWPGTNHWVFEEKWLDKFFRALKENKDWLKTITFSESLKRYNSKGNIYLSSTSYEEMLEWALPVDMQIQMENVLNDIRYLGKEDFYKPFIRGGFWRNFLSKYPESNNMNKKMIYVSNFLEKSKKDGTINPKAANRAAKDLLRGQCNCAYWHGIFGGLYLYHLRSAIYYHLIKSEAVIETSVYGGKDFCEYETIDFDSNGYDEIILKNKELTFIFDPSKGGVIRELDCKKIGHNMINTLARRKESYHGKIIEKIEHSDNEETGEVKTIHEGSQKIDSGITKHFVYDRNEKYCLIDHFFDKNVTLKNLQDLTYNENGTFVFGEYDYKIKKRNKNIIIEMSKNGSVLEETVYLSKKITLKKDKCGIEIVYLISNKGKSLSDIVFSPEFNLIMPHADYDKYIIRFDGDEKRYSFKHEIDEKVSGEFILSDSQGGFSFIVSASEEYRCVIFPVKTVSQSEKAFELNYQGTSIFPLFDLKLNSGEEKEIKVFVNVGC